MTSANKLKLQREGIYIRFLREQQKMSLEAFADRLDIKPRELEAIESGDTEASDKVIRQLPDISNAYEHDMLNFFGDRWKKLKEDGAKAI